MAELTAAHILFAPEPLDLARLRERVDGAVTLTVGAELESPAGFDILVGGRPTLAQLDASPRLRALVIPFAGVVAQTRSLLLTHRRSLPVYNLHHNAAPTAEFAIALLLAAAKRVVPLDQGLRRDDWRPRYTPCEAVCLEHETALILGHGAVGRRVARATIGLGMKPIALRQTVDEDDPPHVRSIDELQQHLPSASALIITLPLTPSTEGMVGPAQLGALPDHSVVVNVGRAAIVDESALYRELESGRLAAGLDVWYRYPSDETARADTAPAAHSFGALDNVVMSPHRAGTVRESERLRMDHLADLLRALSAGDTSTNRVDLEAGY